MPASYAQPRKTGLNGAFDSGPRPDGAVSSAPIPDYFTDSLAHVLAELQRLDVLIQSQVRRIRHLHETDEKFQGLYISEREVDDLLLLPLGSPRFLAVDDPVDVATTQAAFERLGVEVGEQATESIRRGISLRLVELARLFDLTSLDYVCLLVCLAPEIDPRYERLYAYIQDDITRKRPSVELILNLVCPTLRSKLAARSRFAPQAPLQHWKLIHWTDDPSQPQPTLPGRFLRIDERIASYLLGSDEIDARLMPYATLEGSTASSFEKLVLTSDTKRLKALSQQQDSNGTVFYLQGPYGSGKQTIAAACSRESNLGLLVVDGKHAAASSDGEFAGLLRIAAREATLSKAALYWSGLDVLLADEKSVLLAALLRELKARRGLSFLAGETVWQPAAGSLDMPFVRVNFPRPVFAERVQLWERALATEIEMDLPDLANKFRFTAGQIQDAAATARNLARSRDPEAGSVVPEDVYEACRLHSSRNLAALGRKVKTRQTWNDIVLPDDRVLHLREICDSMKYRSLVYDKWGFDDKLTSGKGLNVLFAGPSGTGKTMAAAIMAGELGLDLYKIDLSTVVSKYIGETEKNLARIFAEAETSNAILFFDEADALFGKRSEVRDSHDRYANIEINYLLQKMEEHEGVVILATNFRKNMDDAFVRRIHFTVEFPLPGEIDRRLIWERVWPKDTPRAGKLDLDFMARRFEITGANIRNIAVNAAFRAASDSGQVNMNHLLHSTRREYQKMGKVMRPGEFE